jgi:cold shock protein
MTLGKVTSFDAAQRYGFVRAADNPRDIFIGRSALDRAGLSELSLGQELEYDVGCDGGTLIAQNIRTPGSGAATAARWPL